MSRFKKEAVVYIAVLITHGHKNREYRFDIDANFSINLAENTSFGIRGLRFFRNPANSERKLYRESRINLID